MIVEICVGSSCYLKGSQDIVQMFEEALEANKLKDEVTLTGSFCIGRCNRTGVTIQVDGEVFTGVTREGFGEFFQKNIMSKLGQGA